MTEQNTQDTAKLIDEKIRTETLKLLEESAKIKTERVWLPVTITAASVAGVMTLINALINWAS